LFSSPHFASGDEDGVHDALNGSIVDLDLDDDNDDNDHVDEDGEDRAETGI